jgi:hypothetical protein
MMDSFPASYDEETIKYLQEKSESLLKEIIPDFSLSL